MPSKISITTPVFNEDGNLRQVRKRLLEILETMRRRCVVTKLNSANYYREVSNEFRVRKCLNDAADNRYFIGVRWMKVLFSLHAGRASQGGSVANKSSTSQCE